MARTQLDRYTIVAEVGAPPTVEVVRSLRRAAGWDDDTTERWQECLDTALVVAAAYDADGALVGMGMLTGSLRHAVLCDLVVHPDHRRRGLGRALVEARLSVADELGCRYAYVGLSDENGFGPLYASAGLDEAAWSGELHSWRPGAD